MSEQWRPVTDWLGFYEASDLGRVRSVLRTIRRRDGTTQLQHSNKDLGDSLFAFGGLMLGEANSGTRTIDTKAAALEGWSLVALSFLFVSSTGDWIQTNSWLVVVGTGAAAVSSMVAAVSAALALGLRSWQWPSERDWLKQELFGDPIRLRMFHVLSMLETHQHHIRVNATKVRYLVVAQLALTVASILVGLMVVGRVVERFFSLLF